MSKTTRPGKLTISRWSDNRTQEDSIHLEIEDADSGITFIEVEMTPHEFALALTNFANRPCQYQTRGLQNLGKRCEYRNEIVLVPSLTGKVSEAIIRQAVAAHEVDGWTGRDSDCLNSHYRRRDFDTAGHQAYLVHFNRFVDAEGEDATT